MVESDVEGLLEKVTREDIVETMQKIKAGTATESSEISVGMMVTSDDIRVKVMMYLY